MENKIMAERQEKAAELRRRGLNPYANDFRVSAVSQELRDAHGESSNEQLEEENNVVSIAGRVRAVRKFGKIVFVVLDDRQGTIQANCFKKLMTESDLEVLSLIDVGDFIGVSGPVMKTRNGELSVKTQALQMLTKSIRPLPDKWHGLTDVATRYRQRYVDLMVNPDVRATFKLRSSIIKYIRNYLDDRDYLEVETPMLQSIYGGATARPFLTHHNALDMPLFMRVAPELNLKRLVVGGFHRVYEVNRCFRNEGISTRHNPEFTMLEFYQAFATYEDLMALTEDLLSGLCEHLHGARSITHGDDEISFEAPFRRLSVYDGLVEYAGLKASEVSDRDALLAAAARLHVKKAEDLPLGYLQMEVFETAAEHQLIQPTFVTDFPLDVSPLSRKKDADPHLVDRFELYVAGRELCNAFSELNDPVDQLARFEAQVAQRDNGDDEAHPMDEDYVRALEFGLPPTAGEGIGIDRLAMLMTNSPSIRDVILFPLLRPEA
jgi:lysyl-tRNA synthetase class 2